MIHIWQFEVELHCHFLPGESIQYMCRGKSLNCILCLVTIIVLGGDHYQQDEQQWYLFSIITNADYYYI